MLIDFHTHAFPDALAPRAMQSLSRAIRLTPETDGTVSSLLARMEEWCIDRAVICNIATNARQTVNVNRFAIEVKEQYGNRLFPLGSIHPAFPSREEEIERLKKAGIRGLKIHPDYTGYEIDSPDFDELFDLAAQADMFIVTHAGFDVISPKKIFATPEKILRRLKRSPRTKLVCAHWGANMMWSESEQVLLGQNLWIDVSLGNVSGLPREAAARMLLRHDPDKILFGSDCPWSNAAKNVCFIESLAIPSSLTERIFSQNACHLLGVQ